MKLVSFPDFGAGGIICTTLNKESLVWKDDITVSSYTHDAMKIGSHLEPFDKSKWNVSDDPRWLGTHVHPLDVVDMPEVEQIFYVYAGTLDSICWITARQATWVAAKEGNKDMEQSLTDIFKTRWLNERRWTSPVDHPKVKNVDLYPLVATKFYKGEMFQFQYSPEMWNEWWQRNNMNDVMPLAKKIYLDLKNW